MDQVKYKQICQSAKFKAEKERKLSIIGMHPEAQQLKFSFNFLFFSESQVCKISANYFFHKCELCGGCDALDIYHHTLMELNKCKIYTSHHEM